MMQRLALLPIFFLALSGISRAATNCVQKFTLLGVVQDKENNLVTWIAEEVFGECMWTRIIKIKLLDDSVRVVVDKSYRSWKAIREDMGQPIEGAYIEFNRRESFWEYKNRIYTVTIAEADTSLYNEYKHNVYDPQIWDKKYGSDNVTLPKFNDVKTSLVYYYPMGLYLNYTVDQVYILPKDFLLVFTKQPLLASGLDTMHGFLLLKWKFKVKQ